MPTPAIANPQRNRFIIGASGSGSPSRPLDPGRVSCRLPLRNPSRAASRNEHFRALSPETPQGPSTGPLLRESSSESNNDLGRTLGLSLRPSSPSSSVSHPDTRVRPPSQASEGSLPVTPSSLLGNSKSLLSPAVHSCANLGTQDLDHKHREAIGEMAEKVLGTVLPTIAALREDFERSRALQRACFEELAVELRQEFLGLERTTMPLCQKHDLEIVDLRQRMEGIGKLHSSMTELNAEVCSLRGALKAAEEKAGHSDAPPASGMLASNVKQALSEHSVLYRNLAQSIEAERVDRSARIIEIHADVKRNVQDARSALHAALEAERANRVSDFTELRAVLDSVWQELQRGHGGKRLSGSGSRMMMSVDADVNTVYDMASEALGETVRLSADLNTEREERQQSLLKLWAQVKGLREELGVVAMVKTTFDRHTSEN